MQVLHVTLAIDYKIKLLTYKAYTKSINHTVCLKCRVHFELQVFGNYTSRFNKAQKAFSLSGVSSARWAEASL